MITEASKDYGTGIVTMLGDERSSEIEAWDYLCRNYGMHPSDGSMSYESAWTFRGLENPATWTFTPDKRRETHELKDKSSKGGKRTLIVDPDIVADFTALPFEDESFALVCFDPPHFVRNGEKGWVGLKYGTLKGDWKAELRKGFAECFRVLKHEGTLVFKWNESDIPVSQILALTPERPLFGNRCGKNAQSHWIVFLKQNAK